MTERGALNAQIGTENGGLIWSRHFRPAKPRD
jgi:hypothetical protein